MALNARSNNKSDTNALELRILAVTSANYVASSAGAAATLSFATVTDSAYVVGKIEVGYDAAPTGGMVSVQDYAGNVYFKLPITASGAAPIDLNDLLMPVSTGMKVVLAAPGGAIVGHLNARPHLEK